MKNNLIILLFILLGSGVSAQLPKLSSHSTVAPTIFLDFDGHTVRATGWNNGNTLKCAPSTMTSAQITDIFNRVAEDYRPFNVNITTDSTVFLAAPLNRRMRIIITPTSAWTSNVGGIAYIGSFTWGDDTPGFVFQDRLQNNPKYIAECCSHESGHTLGLAHQSAYNSSCQLVSQYSEGTGTGEIGWAPIMGNSYYKNMTGWNVGPTPYGCSNTQDNLTIITSQNGFTYRADEYPEARSTNTPLMNTNAYSISANGIISTNTDKDAFRLEVLNSTAIHIEAKPFGLNASNTGANLDIKIEVYNEDDVLINSYNKLAYMDVTIDTTLTAGTYYFVVSGTGNSNISNYGSLGSYTISGFAASALPIHSVTLNGSTERKSHKLNWNIVADEPMKLQELEVSTDGTNFRLLSEVDAFSKSYMYSPNQQGNIYYRLRVTSIMNQVAYSNIKVLKSEGRGLRFNVSTFGRSNIQVNASENFDFHLMDMNGRLLKRGKGLAGISSIDINTFPSGVYVLQMYANNERQTERIIKQ